jgi:hypothetical protein
LDAVSRSAASRNWTAVDRAPIFDTTFSGE